MKDYSYLKGKELKVFGKGLVYDYAFVAEIDKDKGITIKGTEINRPEELENAWCVTAELYIDGYVGEGTLGKSFSWCVEQIEKGSLDMDSYPYSCKCDSCISISGSNQVSCAFEG